MRETNPDVDSKPVAVDLVRLAAVRAAIEEAQRHLPVSGVGTYAALDELLSKAHAETHRLSREVVLR